MNKAISFFLFIGFGMLLAIVSGVISKVIDNMIDKDKDLHMRSRGKGDPYWGHYGIRIINRSARSVSKARFYDMILRIVGLLFIIGYTSISVGVVGILVSLVAHSS